MVKNITQKDFGTLAICAIRYCHGRQTYMPDLVREIVAPHLPEVSDNDLTVMIEDCDFQDRMRLYGDERIDKPGWIRWKELLIAEKNRRAKNDCQYTYATCPSHGNDAVFGDGKGNDNICACNKYQPISAQPEQRWIPCDKGEPDENMECWVTVKTTDALYRGNFTKRFGKGFITSGGFMWWNTALAWMPIYEPEPYRTEGDDNHEG